MWCYWLSALFFLLSLRPSAQSNAEGNALYTFKQALKDPMHALSSWNYDLVDPCSSWAHIDCDFRHVVNVNLGNQMLSGVLPPGFGNLPYLNTLVLEDNFLSGSLPIQLGNLTQLVSLNVNNNTLSGSIPDALGNLSHLQHLTLSHNVLSGEIPASLANLYNLATIDLSFNNLSGKIPVALFNIPQFNFVGNHLDCGPGFENPCQGIKNPTSNTSQASSTNKGAIAGGIIGGGSLLAIIALVLSAKKRHTQPQKDIFVDVVGEDDLKVSFGQLKRFSWRELQLATESFSEKNVLGQGGFGRVYKGTLGDGTQVAVKRLKSNHPHGGDAAFLREVEMISVAVHRNLLQLIGFCITVSERLLVYPYMANGSVANRLRERKPEEAVLDWPTRKHIALGAARGLTYLHDHCNPKIIHRDVKAANVLLDKDFEPVVGDFGLAKLVDVKDTHVTTMVRGTMGHIAPEYLLTGKSSERTDIFGYGIMLLELVTGQRAIDFSRLQDEDDVLLLDHVKKLQHQKRLTSLIDPNLEQYELQEVEEFVMVALLCTQSTPEERPSMEDVVRMLSGEGLKERWEEWVKEEVIRRHEYEMMPRRLAEWTEDSTFNQQAVELSGAR